MLVSYSPSGVFFDDVIFTTSFKSVNSFFSTASVGRSSLPATNG